MSPQLSRNEAFEILKEYNKNESLIKHGLAVEGAMRTSQKFITKMKKNGE